MRIFDNLVDSYRSKNYTEFEELCKSSLTLDPDSFVNLMDLLENALDVKEAYRLILGNYPKWVED